MSSSPAPTDADKALVNKMLSDAAVPPQIISEVLANSSLTAKLNTIVAEALASGKPAGAATWAKVEAALAEAGIKRQRVDLGMIGGDGPKGPPQELKEGEEKLIREYLGGGGAPDSLIKEVLSRKDLAEGVLGVARKAQNGGK